MNSVMLTIVVVLSLTNGSGDDSTRASDLVILASASQDTQEPLGICTSWDVLCITPGEDVFPMTGLRSNHGSSCGSRKEVRLGLALPRDFLVSTAART